MPKIKRITRRDLRKNELFEAIQKVVIYIKENPRKIKIGASILGGAFLLLLIANLLIKRAINIPKENLAQSIFSYHYSGNERFSQGLSQFSSFLSRHKKGKLSDIAMLYKASSEKGLKDYATATKTLLSLVKKEDNIISSTSLMNLGNIEEERGNYKKAIEYYKLLLEKNDYLKKYAKERIAELKKIKIGTPSTSLP